MRYFWFLLISMFIIGTVHAQSPKVCFEKSCVDVFMAITDSEKMRGLSGHAPLERNQGMLFVFEKEGKHTFWMHDMTFNLDILWLDKTGKIVDFKQDLSPCTPTGCPKYGSINPALYVLEVPAGYIKAKGLKQGDVARLP